jgi:hypothetical protein
MNENTCVNEVYGSVCISESLLGQMWRLVGYERGKAECWNAGDSTVQSEIWFRSFVSWFIPNLFFKLSFDPSFERPTLNFGAEALAACSRLSRTRHLRDEPPHPPRRRRRRNRWRIWASIWIGDSASKAQHRVPGISCGLVPRSKGQYRCL